MNILDVSEISSLSSSLQKSLSSSKQSGHVWRNWGIVRSFEAVTKCKGYVLQPLSFSLETALRDLKSGLGVSKICLSVSSQSLHSPLNCLLKRQPSMWTSRMMSPQLSTSSSDAVAGFAKVLLCSRRDACAAHAPLSKDCDWALIEHWELQHDSHCVAVVDESDRAMARAELLFEYVWSLNIKHCAAGFTGAVVSLERRRACQHLRRICVRWPWNRFISLWSLSRCSMVSDCLTMRWNK